jgi:hypothetical protein
MNTTMKSIKFLSLILLAGSLASGVLHARAVAAMEMAA